MHEQSRFISDERAIEAGRLWGRQRETGVMEMLSWFSLPPPPVCWCTGCSGERTTVNSCEHGVRAPRLAGMRLSVQHSHHSFQVSLDEIPHLPVCNLPV